MNQHGNTADPFIAIVEAQRLAVGLLEIEFNLRRSSSLKDGLQLQYLSVLVLEPIG